MEDRDLAARELDRVVRVLRESARALSDLSIGLAKPARAEPLRTVPNASELDDLDQLSEQLREMPDDELVRLLLTAHERATASARSPATRQRLLRESRVILACLARFAAGSLTRALAETAEEPDEDAGLQCVQCGRRQRGVAERGWRTFLTSVAPPALATFCPDCAESARPAPDLDAELASRVPKET
jgi:hypothetical protein